MASSAYSDRRRRRRRQRSRSPVVVSFNPAANQRRLLLVWGVLILTIVVIAGRLTWLQLIQGDNLATRAQQQHLSAPVQRQMRHSMVDRQRNILAIDQVVYTLYAHPELFDTPIQDVATALAPLLNQPMAELLEHLAQRPTGIRVVDGLPEATVDRIRALRLNGLELQPQQQRFYPQQQLFAPVVGFVNFDGEPQAGLEIAYQDQLSLAPPAVEPDLKAEVYGPPESLLTAATAETAAPNPPAPATAHWPNDNVSLQLTLDSRLQRTTQHKLQAVVDRYNAKRGTVMVMAAQTGEILALASVPTYDPNQYYQADLSDLKSWAISDLYEPGSTFKPINIAIALEAGLITPDDMVNDSGQIQFGKWKIRNHDYDTVGGRGHISITDVLKYSSNVGMARIMQKMPASDYFSWLQRLTLDGPTGIDLPAEAAGQIKDREHFINSRVESATAAFGQGFSLSPIKMLQLQGILANGGRLVTPHLVKGMIDTDGETVWTPPRPQPKSIFSPQTTQQVLTMMEAVVSTGTGDAAKLSGYRIGGKTGTAQKAAASGGYGRERVTSFVGILPANDPRYVVLTIIDEPQGEDAYGGTVAAPLTKSVIESLVVLEGLPPDAEQASD
jgi:cell division protein FtsI (penicillin-binding protein 3)